LASISASFSHQLFIFYLAGDDQLLHLLDVLNIAVKHGLQRAVILNSIQPARFYLVGDFVYIVNSQDRTFGTFF
jgi:hypothetical protein